MPLIIVSGIPGSGKSTLAKALSQQLSVPLVDKDDILESLLDTLGVGDAAWRRRLSRASDDVFRIAVQGHSDCVATSFWRHPRSDSRESGTPIDWLRSVVDDCVEVYCRCDPVVAATRFANRIRHPGHLDRVRFSGVSELEANLSKQGALGPLGVGKLIVVETESWNDERILALQKEIKDMS